MKNGEATLNREGREDGNINGLSFSYVLKPDIQHLTCIAVLALFAPKWPAAIAVKRFYGSS